MGTVKSKHMFDTPKPEQHFFTESNMPRYNKTIILRLAEMFSGNELEKRLKNLKFCSYKTALAILNRSDSEL